MSHRIYVGNLPFSVTPSDLEQLFGPYGPVRSVDVIQDRLTGRSRGFGFVELDSIEAMAAAIQGLHGRDMQGRGLTVHEARERTQSSDGSRTRGASEAEPRRSGAFDSGGSHDGRTAGYASGRPSEPRFERPRREGFTSGPAPDRGGFSRPSSFGGRDGSTGRAFGHREGKREHSGGGDRETWHDRDGGHGKRRADRDGRGDERGHRGRRERDSDQDW
jgi:RNA recognition motif-containing protein